MARHAAWCAFLLFLGLNVAPVRAQLPVIDASNLTQTILIAERTPLRLRHGRDQGIYILHSPCRE